MSTILLAFDEGEKLVHLRNKLPVAAQNFPRRVDSDFRPIDKPMRFRQAIDYMRSEFMALERNDVNAPRPGRGPFAEHEWRHVVQHTAQTADKAVAADRGEMVHRDRAA
jgi:hypothetical protein